MARDLSDPFAEIRALKDRIRILETATPLQNSSITRGRLRVAGGLLLIDDGGTLQVIGTVDGEGNFQWSGPWKFDSGDGEIAGDVELTGNFSLTGVFAAGNVRIEDGKIYVGAGTTTIVIDGATGRIIAGSMTIDPSLNGGSVKFAGGPEVYASGAQLSLYSGTGAFIELDGDKAKINGPGARWVEVNSAGVRFVGLPTGAPSTAKAVLVDPATGQAYRGA
ncbi:hypothetical protein [Microbacterium sp. 1.5R]|uniref:hypothetical protein n=1 Tax=Microbacterium sp. 1.5R TaxID=1916917 RepID=UPI0011A86B7C|nr:hypothetical protein [Microbacterium sp. 1.5R]